jgi:hypothetical protein
MTWDDGDCYEGPWLEGEKHGYGEYWKRTGRKWHYKGRYEKDQKDGDGKIIYEDGEIYDGNWMMGKKEGSGTQ